MLKKKKKRRGSRFRCMRLLCSVFSRCESRGLPTNPSTGKNLRAERERERVSILFHFLLISLLYRLICQMVFPKRDDDDDKRERTYVPTTSKIEKKKLPRRPPRPFFLFLIPQSIYHILDPRLVPSISFLISLQQNPRKKQKEINRTSGKRKNLRLFIADSDKPSSASSCTRVGILYQNLFQTQRG